MRVTPSGQRWANAFGFCAAVALVLGVTGLRRLSVAASFAGLLAFATAVALSTRSRR